MNESLSAITRDLLRKYNIRLNKRFGQNLLIDQAALNRIINAADLSYDDIVIEIGTGTGILTKALAEIAKKVISYEIDNRIFEVAKDYLKGINNIELINEDFLTVGSQNFVTLQHKLTAGIKIVANVPYYITSPIIEKIFENKKLFSKVILTVQKEFAERMIAKPGSKAYGSFSIFVNYHSMPKILSNIPKTSFLPQPEIGSVILSLEIREKPSVKVKDEKLFFEVVRAAFGQRRKTLRNCLLNKFEPEIVAAAFQESGIDPKRRGETLSIEEFAHLSDLIYLPAS